MKKTRIFISVTLSVLLLFSLFGCGKGTTAREKFESYKKDRCVYLDGLREDNNDVSLIILFAQNDIVSLKWEDEKSLEENMGTVDAVVSEAEMKIEEIMSPTMDLSKYLTADGYLMKNSMEAPKADYYTDSEASVAFTNEEREKIKSLSDTALRERLEKVKKASDFYISSVVSFTQKGKIVLTTHYTELGAAYLTACGQQVKADEPIIFRGTYRISNQAKRGTTLCPIQVDWKDGTHAVFYIDAQDGKIYKNGLFEQEELTAFTLSDILANSGTGSVTEPWEEGKDGVVQTNIRYGNRERNVFDLYLPINIDKTRENGIILFIHGGSWTSGGKEELQNYCKKYAKEGYITASMNHTYAATVFDDGTKSTLYTIDDEVDSVFAKVKELSEQNGWNITKSALYGYSSGCHIAFLYAYGKGNREDAPIPVKFVSGMVGCMDFREEYWRNVEMDGPSVAAVGVDDMRLVDKENPYSTEEYNRIIDTVSPLSFAKKGDAVPSIVAYADLDETLIDYIFASVLETELNRFGIENYCVSFPNSGHFTGNNPEFTKKYFAKLNEFLKKYFGY